MKKISTRIVSLALALLLLVQIVPTALAYGNHSDWAQPELEEMEEKGLFPSTFESADMTVKISRLELCQMAVVAYKKITGRDVTARKTNYFKDTRDANVCIAYELGIVSGYEDSTFRPNRQLTREELFTMVYNLFRSVGWTEDEIQELFASFRDCKKVSKWATDATKIMLEIGVTQGTGNNQIDPAGNTTVEQALTMFLRAYNYYIDWITFSNAGPGVLPEEPPTLETHFYSNVSDWAEESVNKMEALELVPERLNGADLTRNITREEMCEIAMLSYVKITGDGTASTTNYFKDTTNPNINTAFEKLIVSGYEDGTFRPQKNITREEFFRIIYNLLAAVGWERYDNTYELFAQFKDHGNISDWAKTAAKVMIELEVTKGDGVNLLPGGTATREEAALMFYRGYKYIELWYSEHPLDPDSYPGTPHIVSPTAEKIVALAYQQLGKPYVWGATGPNSFDCSGLTYWLYKQYGYTLNRVANDQWRNGVRVSKENMLPGDLLFFVGSSGSNYITHVGIYAGAGMFLHAANSKLGVIKASINDPWVLSHFYGARRIIY